MSALLTDTAFTLEGPERLPGLVRGLLLGADPCGLHRPHQEGFPCWLRLSQPPASSPPGILQVLGTAPVTVQPILR